MCKMSAVKKANLIHSCCFLELFTVSQCVVFHPFIRLSDNQKWQHGGNPCLGFFNMSSFLPLYQRSCGPSDCVKFGTLGCSLLTPKDSPHGWIMRRRWGLWFQRVMHHVTQALISYPGSVLYLSSSVIIFCSVLCSGHGPGREEGDFPAV